jgi:hypothetical protein
MVDATSDTTKTIAIIEETLTIELPAHYKAWVACLPPPGKENREWEWAFNDADYIIQVNQELRQEGCYGNQWPVHLFAMADFDGNYFFLDTHRPERGIYYTNHDAGPYYRFGDFESCHYASSEAFYSKLGAAP